MTRILLVDDEPHVIRVLAQSLEREGYEITSARNGEQALQLVLADPPDLLITDIDMPKMNGRQLCEKIVEIMPDRQFTIFMLTSRTELEHREWSNQMLNMGFIEKPVSLRKLKQMLFEVFTGSGAKKGAKQ